MRHVGDDNGRDRRARRVSLIEGLGELACSALIVVAFDRVRAEGPAAASAGADSRAAGDCRRPARVDDRDSDSPCPARTPTARGRPPSSRIDIYAINGAARDDDRSGDDEAWDRTCRERPREVAAQSQRHRGAGRVGRRFWSAPEGNGPRPGRGRLECGAEQIDRVDARRIDATADARRPARRPKRSRWSAPSVEAASVRTYIGVGIDTRGRSGRLSKRVTVPLAPAPPRPSHARATMHVQRNEGHHGRAGVRRSGRRPRTNAGPSLPVDSRSGRSRAAVAYNVYDSATGVPTDVRAVVEALEHEDSRIEWGATRCYARARGRGRRLVGGRKRGRRAAMREARGHVCSRRAQRA